MDRYPGRTENVKNLLKLYQKVWYRTECDKFLKLQTPSKEHTLRNITLLLFNYQKKRMNMSYSECDLMVKEHFDIANEEDNDEKRMSEEDESDMEVR